MYLDAPALSVSLPLPSTCSPNGFSPPLALSCPSTFHPPPLPLRHPVPPPFAHPSIHPGLSTHPSMLSLHHYFLRTNWQRVRPPLLEHQPKPARPSYQPLLPHFRACPKCLHQVEGTISASTVKSVALASVYSQTPATALSGLSQMSTSGRRHYLR